MVDCRSPDPTNAINGFLWNMYRAKELGFTPSSAHMMAEHFLRGDVSLVFYSSSGGIISLAADDDALDNDDSFEMVKFIMERVAARRKARREKEAAIAMEAGTGETEGLDAKHEGAGGEAVSPNPEDQSTHLTAKE
jgi:hypothetical protein